MGQCPNSIITILDDGEYVESLYAKLLDIKTELAQKD
jgi:hypothetical protein